MIRQIIDTDDDGVIIADRKQKFNIFDPDKGFLFRAKNHSIKSYLDIKLSDVIKNMDDYCKVHLLAEHIYKDTNIIAIRVNSRKVRMADIDDISNILNISQRRAKDFIKRMSKLHVMAERIDIIGDVVQTKYLFNPLFFNSCKYLSADLYFLFQQSLDCYLPHWVTRQFHQICNIKKG